MFIQLIYVILKVYQIGGDLASTWVAKPEVHAENENSRKSDSLNINANEDNFAGEAIAAEASIDQPHRALP